MIWSFVLAAVGIAGIYLAGKKSKWGWGLGLAAQVLWVVFALTTAQYGFILTAIAYGAVYGKNLWQWHREEGSAPKPAKRANDDDVIVLQSGAPAGPNFSQGGMVINGEYVKFSDLDFPGTLGKSTLESCYDEPLGNDGLTDAERKEYADRYAAGPGRGLDDKGRESLRKMRERRNDQS